MALEEVVILNPRRPAKRRAAKKAATRKGSRSTRKTTAKSRKGGKTMARRKATTRRSTAARRKTTARRRKSPARKRTTRRKTTTRRRKSPARRKTTTRRRRTTRRKPTTRRRKTTRRKPATRRRKTTRRRKPATRRRKTTRRRKSPARRRKTTSRRRRTARRRTVSRRRSARRMKMPRFGGFGKYVRKHLDTSAIGMVLAGLALPTLAVTAYQKLNLSSFLARVPVIGDTVLANPFGQAALGVLVSAGLTYTASSMGLVSESTALGANMIALGVFTATALARTSSMAAQYLPYNTSIDGMHSMAGYRGGYLGYLGEASAPAEMLPAPVEDQLFGVGSAPKYNIF